MKSAILKPKLLTSLCTL